MRQTWRALRLRHVGMAFFWACSMLTFRSSILLQGPADTPGIATLVVVVSFVVNMTVLFALAARAEHNPLFFRRIPLPAVGAVIVAGLILVEESGRLSWPPALYACLCAGAMLAGAGYGFLWGSWAECFGRMHPSRTALYIPLAFLLTALLFLGITLLADSTPVPALALVIPLPLISLGCLARCRDEYAAAVVSKAPAVAQSRAALNSLLGLIIAVMVLSTLFGLVWEMAVLSVRSVTNAHQIPLFGNLIIAIGIIVFVQAAHKHINLTTALRVIIPVLVLLFAVFPCLWQSNPVFLNAVMSTCHGLFDVVLWYAVATAAYDFGVSGFVTGGIVRALSILMRLIGIGIGYVIMLVPESSTILLVATSAAALYALCMLLAFLYTQRRRSRKDALEEAERREAEEAAKKQAEEKGAARDAHEAQPDVFAAIAEDYGLTRREAEVLPFLARGRSARVIADALFVSESTIRTHTRRILEKTDLHSKQQLIDLIEHYE
ncbi:helix-turn-helix transcriptional regulator [Adlercreutzia sp. ZJ305]|nr:helix-turn-helix transcriptional regulator [Adlercreutzia sp. ZJ305]